jgi:hypothetical protein
VLTYDKDYARLHRAGASHAGILLATPDRDEAALAARVHAALSATADLTGRLVRIYLPNPPPSP